MDRKKSADTAHGTLPILKWHTMNGREQTVWAVTYAGSALDPQGAARTADKAILALRALDIDESGFVEPEHEAARYGMGLTYEEFRAWYPTALKIAIYNRRDYQEPDEDAIRGAYDSYRRSTGDFY